MKVRDLHHGVNGSSKNGKPKGGNAKPKPPPEKGDDEADRAKRLAEVEAELAEVETTIQAHDAVCCAVSAWQNESRRMLTELIEAAHTLHARVGFAGNYYHSVVPDGAVSRLVSALEEAESALADCTSNALAFESPRRPLAAVTGVRPKK